MTLKLSDELRKALSHTAGPVEIQDDRSQKTYVIMEISLFAAALKALQAAEDREAIQAGIDDMLSGNVVTFEEADKIIKAQIDSL
jgi:predicted transcriptional regulator